MFVLHPHHLRRLVNAIRAIPKGEVADITLDLCASTEGCIRMAFTENVCGTVCVMTPVRPGEVDGAKYRYWIDEDELVELLEMASTHPLLPSGLPATTSTDTDETRSVRSLSIATSDGSTQVGFATSEKCLQPVPYEGEVSRAPPPSCEVVDEPQCLDSDRIVNWLMDMQQASTKMFTTRYLAYLDWYKKNQDRLALMGIKLPSPSNGLSASSWDTTEPATQISIDVSSKSLGEERGCQSESSVGEDHENFLGIKSVRPIKLWVLERGCLVGVDEDDPLRNEMDPRYFTHCTCEMDREQICDVYRTSIWPVQALESGGGDS